MDDKGSSADVVQVDAPSATASEKTREAVAGSADVVQADASGATASEKTREAVAGPADIVRVDASAAIASEKTRDAVAGSAVVVQVDASCPSQGKNVPAARARSADYELIIENTVAGLGRLTPEKRSKVYALARTVVMRHLQSEKLALDLAIGQIERRWRARDAAENVAPKKAMRFNGRRPRIEPPAIATVPVAASSRRRLARSIGVAVALPVFTATIFFGFRVGDEVADRSVADGLVEHWFTDSSGKPGVGGRLAAADVSPHRNPSSPAAPTGAALAVEPEAPAPSLPSLASSGGKGGGAACRSGSSMAEHNPCARDSSGRGMAAETSQTETGTRSLDSFTAFGDIASGQELSRTLTLPTVTPADFMADRAYAAPARDEALMSVAALPRAAAPAQDEALKSPDASPRAAGPARDQVPASPDASPRAAGPARDQVPASPDASPRAAAPQVPQPSATKPVNAKVAALVASGNEAALKGDLDRAVRDFSEAIRIDPKYADSYSERGQALFRLGETERAIADYSAALAHDPQHGAALRSRGMAHLYLGKNDLALADLSKAIELGEQDPQLVAPIELFYARRSRASIYDSTQQYDLEIADCTALIEAYAHNSALVDTLAANYGSAGAANVLARVYRQRASAFARRSSVERALADLTEAIPLSSDRGYAALIDRSKLHEGLGQRDLAVADARAALNIRPGSEEARLALSRLSALSNQTPPKGL
jgi:tetratricopeptide (TPR) repeat protein